MNLSTQLVWEKVDIQRNPWIVNHGGKSYFLRVSLAPERGRCGWCGTYHLSTRDLANPFFVTKTQHFDTITDDVIWVQDALSWAEDVIMTPMDQLARSLNQSE